MSANTDTRDQERVIAALQDEPDADTNLKTGILVLPVESFRKWRTPTWAKNFTLLDIDWTSEWVDQVVCRIHRIDFATPTSDNILFTDLKIDQKMKKILDWRAV